MRSIPGSDKMLRLFHRFAWLLIGICLLAGCNEEQDTDPAPVAEPTATLLPFTRYSDPVSLEFLYPSSWTYSLLRQGLLLFGPASAMALEGEGVQPTLLVYRRSPNAGVTLHDEMDNFLAQGPLASGFQLQGSLFETEQNGKQVLIASVSRAAGDEQIAANSLIWGWEAQSQARYILVATAASEEWGNWAPNFEVMLSSVNILE